MTAKTPADVFATYTRGVVYLDPLNPSVETWLRTHVNFKLCREIGEGIMTDDDYALRIVAALIKEGFKVQNTRSGRFADFI